MLPASNRGPGQSLNFPDVCKTPAPPAPFVPVPYPDLGMNMQAAPFSPFVQVGFVPATNMGSMKTMTSGDETGVMGGMTSSMIKGPGKTTMGNPIILIDGLPAESLANPTSGNMMNAPIGIQLVPSVINVLYTYRSPSLEQATQADPAVSSSDHAHDPTVPFDELGDVARGDGAASSQVQASWLTAGLAYLRIGIFGGNTDREVFNALRQLGRDAIDGVVLDLRGNRGGDARAAIRLAEAWLADGTVLLLERDGDGDIEPVVARGEATYAWPLRVLIDEASASAAEIVAATLQHHGRARVFGTRSHGKATAQSAVRWPDGGIRYATVAEFLLPDGGAIDGCGVVPDELPTVTRRDAPGRLDEAAGQLLAARR